MGRSASSARRRLAGLIESGVLVGFLALPDPAALGLGGVAATWPRSTEAGRLFAIEGTIMAGTNIAGGTLAGAFTDDGDAWVDRASEAVGAPAATRMDLAHYTGPLLGPLDLRVMRAMVLAPRGSAEALAKHCGLAAKTVRRRRATLLADKAVSILPMVRTGATDSLLYHLHVTCRQEQKAAVLAVLEEAGEVSTSPDDDPLLCAFIQPPSLRGQARTLAAIEALGVDNVEVIHEDAWEVRQERLLARVDEALASWGRGPGP